jgi:phosphocarrier protein
MTDSPIELLIKNQKGLHARAAASFVKCVSEYDAEVVVEKDGQSVDGSSILGLMMLSASKGSTIKVSATGTDASVVLERLTDLVDSLFGEEQ